MAFRWMYDIQKLYIYSKYWHQIALYYLWHLVPENSDIQYIFKSIKADGIEIFDETKIKLIILKPLKPLLVLRTWLT